ncbi:hypothetical protein RIR_jg27295.t1 [Rhizophagus irregularis DAOM 181602=DAOM 197198]|nr:hypothetical protein RIR_jg27295.t1 [Rhizophagus irregularis DAOM 181602=DAOM 197198]
MTGIRRFYVITICTDAFSNSQHMQQHFSDTPADYTSDGTKQVESRPLKRDNLSDSLEHVRKDTLLNDLDTHVIGLPDRWS